jgi:hypothetical protein
MTIEELLKKKIEKLESVIEFRTEDEDWLKADSGNSESNEYMWFWNGQQDNYNGRLKALKELMEEIK